MTDNIPERRKGSIRRGIKSLAMRDGETQESKLWALIGKCLCVWLIYKYAEELIEHWEVLLVLISWLIAPDIAKKAITMRYGGDSGQTGYTRHTSHTESETTTNKTIDHPPPKEEQ